MSDVPPPPPPPPPSYGAPPPSPGGSLDVGAAVSYAWKKFQEHAAQLVLIALVIALVNLIGFALRFTINSFLGAMLLQVVFFIIGQIVTIGIINAALMVTRGEQPELGKVFATDQLGPFIVASLLYGLAILVGLILCILPGIIAAFTLGFYGFYVLDKRMSPTEALGASWNLVTKNLGSVLLLVIVAFAIYFVGALLCGIGLLVAAPLCWVMLAYGYRELNGEAVAP